MTSQDIISDNVRMIFQWLIYSCLCELICTIGVITNVINIIIFVKLGFKDTVNISLFGLAISDMGCVVTLLWTNICFNPSFINLDLPFEPIEFQYVVTSGSIHIIFTRVTSCITAFITLERCMCVTVPLKVKSIFTPRRVVSVITAIFVAVMGSMIPVFYVSRLAVKYSYRRNKTLIGLVFSEERQKIQSATYSFSSVCVPLSALAVVLVCTAVLVMKLRNKLKWRETSVVLFHTGTHSVRDQRVTKMIIAISSFFIVCFTPVCLEMITMIVDLRFSIQGQFSNLFICVTGLCFTLEATNSAANMFIYYHMSTKYRDALHSLLFTAV